MDLVTNMPNDQNHGGHPLLFPQISDFVNKLATEASASGSSTAERLHNLANQRPEGLRAWCGWGLAPGNKLAHLFALYKWAVKAEVGGYWQRADFYWRELFDVLRRDWSKTDFWKAAAQVYSEGVNLKGPESGEEFRDLMVREVFVDTFCGLYNGRVQRGEVSEEDRAFCYVEGLERLLTLTNSSDAERKSLLTGPYRLRIHLLRQEKRWSQAIQACELAINVFPESVEFQNALADTALQHAFVELTSSESTTQNETDAGLLTSQSVI